MDAVSTVQSHRDSHKLLGIVLALLAVCALWFIRKNLLHYFIDYSPASYTAYLWPRRGALIPHALGGLLAITTGLVQIWLGLTHRVGTLHRTLGKVYCAGVLVASLAGYYLVITIPSKYLVYGTGLFALCTAWIVTTSMAVIAIRNRQFEQHREWMLRSYTVTFAFATFRLLEHWLIDHHVASPDDVDAILAWACWSVPLLLLEPLIQLQKLHRRGHKAQPREGWATD
jgi:uncharacterized membrane protein